jgi:hypothetical protein
LAWSQALHYPIRTNEIVVCERRRENRIGAAASIHRNIGDVKFRISRAIEPRRPLIVLGVHHHQCGFRIGEELCVDEREPAVARMPKADASGDVCVQRP